MNRFFRFFLIFNLCLFSLQSFAQESKSKKKLEEKKAAKEKSSAKVIQEGEEFHMKIQTKETRKRMKESKKKAAMINSNTKEPFYKRWFKRKHH
jgi:uncharacterized membrane protein